MALFPEREPRIKPVEERPEEASSLTIERKEVVSPIPTQFKAQVEDDQGRPLITATATQEISIQLPQPVEVLQKESGGDISNALTWWAGLWMRLFKKYVFRNSTGS